MSETVLIVDDSLTVRMDLAEAFSAAGFEPLPCATLGEARQAFAQAPVAIVVLDVLLPDGDGVDLLKEVRASETTSSVPVLMLSTEAEIKDRVRALQVGADEYVGKPYDSGYVVAKAREILRARRIRDGGGGGTSVLIVDDSVTFREALREACEAAGYRVLTAASGEEGLRIAADQRPNAVLVDGQLPGIDGAAVIRHIRLDAALRGLPCLLLTASEERNAELSALDAGADAFARKEDSIEMILAKLAVTLRRAAAPSGDTVSLLGPRKILAVDDSATYLHELAGTLRGEGYDAVLARSGEEALELLAVQPVDCILLDLVMPGLGGKETCRQIKSAPMVRDIPLIMLTASEERAAMLDGLAAGADDYVPKSSEFEVLKARIRAQMRRKQFEDENRRIREELLQKEIETTEARAARELAETRAALVEELKRKNKELEAFSYSVSHDLRAPLRSIDGFSQVLLEDHAEALDATGRDYLGRVRSAAQRMGELIDDLLQLSQMGRAPLRRQRIDLAPLARKIVETLRRGSPDREVRARIADELPADADPGLLRVVLENLIGNAWKFTGGTPSAAIEIGAEKRMGGLVYFVRDNGAGFDAAYADKLFAPFQRLHSAAEFPGTGIGLATVHRVVERHGGRIWAEGKIKHGATFYWTLPPLEAKGTT